MRIIYIVKYVYSDIINNVKRTRQNKKRGIKNENMVCMGYKSPKIEIKANSFDNAIAQARKINKNYNTGQLK